MSPLGPSMSQASSSVVPDTSSLAGPPISWVSSSASLVSRLGPLQLSGLVGGVQSMYGKYHVVIDPSFAFDGDL